MEGGGGDPWGIGEEGKGEGGRVARFVRSPAEEIKDHGGEIRRIDGANGGEGGPTEHERSQSYNVRACVWMG